MEIGILEYQKFHSVYSDTLERICEDHKVYLYNNPKYAKKDSKKLDLLFVNTIKPLPWDIIKWLGFKSKCKTILTIHEANTDLFFNRILLNKFDVINVLHQNIKDYILENKLYNGKIFTLPFMLHEKVYPNINNMIVVPGRIEGFRRDYNVILKIMRKDEHWCLLGKPVGTYGHCILEECATLRKEGYNIETFKTVVPNNIYENILMGCKMIYAPLKNPTVGLNKLCKEIYGKTKAVGSMFEAMKYGKTFMCTEDIKLDYKDYLLKDWKKYFEKEIVEGLVNEQL